MQNLLAHVNRKVLIGAGVAAAVIVAGAIYYALTDRPEADGALTALEDSTLDGTIGRDLLLTLSRLRSTKLDVSIFEDPVFSSLKDFGVEIAPQPVGRRNPFAVFGAAKAPAKGPAAPALPKGQGGTKAPGDAPQAPATDSAPEEEFSGFDFE